ncbi:hypothetical protein LINPERHAP2_LOCUS23009 [Linum perenne]
MRCQGSNGCCLKQTMGVVPIQYKKGLSTMTKSGFHNFDSLKSQLMNNKDSRRGFRARIVELSRECKGRLRGRSRVIV